MHEFGVLLNFADLYPFVLWDPIYLDAGTDADNVPAVQQIPTLLQRRHILASSARFPQQRPVRSRAGRRWRSG